jgi:hypothetical protein
MESHKDLSGLYILIGAILGFVVAVVIVMSFALPRMRMHDAASANPLAKPSIAETHAETRVLITSACIGAAIGMFAGYKVFSLRKRRNEAAQNNSQSSHS